MTVTSLHTDGYIEIVLGFPSSTDDGELEGRLAEIARRAPAESENWLGRRILTWRLSGTPASARQLASWMLREIRCSGSRGNAELARVTCGWEQLELRGGRR